MILLATRRLLILVAIVIAVWLLGGCTYTVSELAQLVPKPGQVIPKPPVDIVDAQAQFTLVNKQDYGYWDWACYIDDWGYEHCYSYWVWTRTDATGNVSFTIDAKDPSRDLNGNPARVRILKSELPSGGNPRTGNCLLNIDRQDIALQPTDITGTDQSKVVSVTIRNVTMSFTSQCRVFTAEIHLRLIVDDKGFEVVSPSEGKATVTIKKM